MAEAGRFLLLLQKPKIACKPKGDQDPFPEEWDMQKPEEEKDPAEIVPEEDAMQEDAEEEAWRSSTAAIQVDKDELQPVPEEEEYHEEAEEEEPHDDDDVLADADAPPKEDMDEELERSQREYEEMDQQMGSLKKFVEDEHGKGGHGEKRKHEEGDDKDHADESGWQHNKYRNKGKGGHNQWHGYYNQNWNYNKGKNHGKGWKGWHHGKGKGKGKWQPKWKSNWNREDWTERDGMVLQASKKGGWYLPNGQGYLDADGKFHPHLGLD